MPTMSALPLTWHYDDTMLQSVDATSRLHVKMRKIASIHQLAHIPLTAFTTPTAHTSAWFGSRISIIGIGQTVRHECAGENSIRRLGHVWQGLRERLLVDTSESLPGVFGFPELPIFFFSGAFYDTDPSVLLVPELVVFDLDGERWAVSTSLSCASDPIELATRHRTEAQSHPLRVPVELRMEPGRMTQDQWVDSVGKVIERLRRGDAQKAVMTRDLCVDSPHPFDTRYLLDTLSSRYPTTWRFAVDGLIGATPEMLASVHLSMLHSRVLAGTAPFGHAEELVHSQKNLHEHRLAVQSVAQALEQVALRTHIPSKPSVLTLPNVIHLATDVEAVLEDASIFDAVNLLHPTAAVCGFPRLAAVNILTACERTERGRYCGPVGWVDTGGDGEFGLALRCGQLENDGHRLRIFAGSGIMPDSEPQAELAETQAKMAPLLEVLGVTEGM